MNRFVSLLATALCATAATWPGLAMSDAVATEATRGGGGWQFGAFIYGYYPDIAIKSTLPNGNSSDVTVDAKDIFNNLKFAALGSFEARKDKWGVFSDFIYMNVGQFKSQYHNFTIGNVGLPADVSASLNFNLKSVVWTVAGTYRTVASQQTVLDVFGGARLLDTKVTLDWTLNGNLGPIPAAGRAGTGETRDSYVDGIVGIKGRTAFGSQLQWFVPYYVDAGTGNSDLTWQVMAGLGYAFKWGDLISGWRYMDYKFKSGSPNDTESFNGPFLGAAFHW
jgi:hypothetical protein